MLAIHKCHDVSFVQNKHYMGNFDVVLLFGLLHDLLNEINLQLTSFVGQKLTPLTPFFPQLIFSSLKSKANLAQA